MNCLVSKPIVVISIALLSLSLLPAQTFKRLHSFDAPSGGREPNAGLVIAGVGPS